MPLAILGQAYFSVVRIALRILLQLGQEREPFCAFPFFMADTEQF